MCGRGAPHKVLLVTLVIMFLMTSVPSAQAEATSWSWAAPRGYDGAAAVRVWMDFGTDNVCDIELAAIGSGHGPFVFFGFGEDSWYYLHGSTIVQVHDQENGFDTRTVHQGGGGFGITVIHSGQTWSGVHQLTVFNADSYLSDGPTSPDFIPPLEILVECAEPVAPVAFAGSQEAVSFSQDIMDGTGASVNARGRGAAVSDGDRFQATLQSEDTQAFLHVEDTQALALRTWSLEAPDGETTVSSGPSVGAKSWLFVDSGPGTWTFELSQVSANGIIEGWFAGFPPVESLDDVFV